MRISDGVLGTWSVHTSGSGTARGGEEVLGFRTPKSTSRVLLSQGFRQALSDLRKGETWSAMTS